MTSTAAVEVTTPSEREVVLTRDVVLRSGMERGVAEGYDRPARTLAAVAP